MIVGISGRINSGKDTVGRMWGWEIRKFADFLKQRIALTWGLLPHDLEDRKFKDELSPLGITWRKLMQLEGEKMREIDPEYWVKALFEHYYAGETLAYNGGFRLETKEMDWCITDLRYPNEAKAVKDRGGILIKVVRKCEYCNQLVTEQYAHKMGCERPNKSEHISETALDDYGFWDYVIENTGTIEELGEKVTKIKQQI